MNWPPFGPQFEKGATTTYGPEELSIASASFVSFRPYQIFGRVAETAA